MRLSELHTSIRKRHETEPYSSIAFSLGINKALVKYIETHPHYRPSRRIAAILKLDPDNDLRYTRTRRERLDEIARSKGHKSWCALETHVLKEYEKGK